MNNIFLFNTLDSIVATLTMLFMGLFFGMLLGFIRYVLFAFMERTYGTPWGKEVRKTWKE